MPLTVSSIAILRRLQRPLSGWLAAMVLLANMLVGGLAPVAWGDGMVVCTADGIQVVGPDGQKRPATTGGHEYCLLCLPLAHGGLDLPPQAPAVVLPQPLPLAGWPIVQPAAFRLRPAATPGLARAPPSV